MDCTPRSRQVVKKHSMGFTLIQRFNDAMQAFCTGKIYALIKSL